MDKMIDVINMQWRNEVERLEKREIISQMLLYKLSSFFGRKYYAMGLRYLLGIRALSRTFSFSNIGNMDKLNSYGTKASLCEAISSTPSQSLFLSMSTLNNEIHTVFTYQEAEFTRDDILRIIEYFEKVLKGINAGS